jgi:hypothetical protein
MQDLSRRMAELSAELGDVGPQAYAFRYLGHPDRAMIGVVLGADAHGVRISAVTPDGPAARAGLREGDVITAIDGKALAKGEDDALADARERLSGLKDADTVRIAYRRGARDGTVSIAAERREAWNWPALMGADPEHPFLPRDFNERIRADVERARAEASRAGHEQALLRGDLERVRAAGRANAQDMREAVARGRAALRAAMPWWGLNLAPVNAGLGRYFGTDRGALVIAADDAALPGLHAGDVITGVAGEPVARPEDALRALRDQPAGRQVRIDVLRDHRAVALELKSPEFKSIFELPPLPPAPPEAPAAPAAPAAPLPPQAPVAAPSPPPPPPAER